MRNGRCTESRESGTVELGSGFILRAYAKVDSLAQGKSTSRFGHSGRQPPASVSPGVAVYKWIYPAGFSSYLCQS